MTHQIIQQPDGAFAVWDTSVDDWVLYDASAEELANHYADEAAAAARTRVEGLTLAVSNGAARQVYFQFAMTFDEAQERRRKLHGDAPWPPE